MSSGTTEFFQNKQKNWRKISQRSRVSFEQDISKSSGNNVIRKI